MRVFLSFSFRDEDRDLVNVVERLLASHSARLVSGRSLGGANLTDTIKQQLMQADALLALFTRRDLLADGTWTTHAWVRDEYVYAQSINKPALALVEHGVAFDGFGQGQEFISLDRGALLPALLALSETLGRWREEFAQQQEAGRSAREQPRSTEGQPQMQVKRGARRETAGKPKDVPRVFINYRRENAQGRAGRLADTLRLFLGERNVFYDQDDIPPGSTSSQRACVLLPALASCLQSSAKTGPTPKMGPAASASTSRTIWCG